MPDETTTLYRPVGQKEFDLIKESGFRRFPPRLPEQPFFYPVLNEQYATQIARDWNTRDERSVFVGYVLRFEVRKDFLDCYENTPPAVRFTRNFGFLQSISTNSTRTS